MVSSIYKLKSEDFSSEDGQFSFIGEDTSVLILGIQDLLVGAGQAP